jgi:hypothetical protein
MVKRQKIKLRLEKSIRKDPWITRNPRKYAAGPNRVTLQTLKKYRAEYNKNFVCNFFTSMCLAWPLLI